MMKKRLISRLVLIAGILSVVEIVMASSSAIPKIATSAVSAPHSSEKLEKDLQNLSWPQFNFVVKSIPKLKAKVDAFGPAGWRYVQKRYQSFGWKKSIDKFNTLEKEQLAALIRKAEKQ